MNIKKNFLTGLIILLPIAITSFIFVFFFELLTRPFVGYVEELFSFFFRHVFMESEVQYKGIVYFFSSIFVIFFLFFAVVILGFLGQKLAFRWLVHLTQKIFLRIPFIKTVYRILQDITRSMLKEKGSLYEKTAIVGFPYEQTSALCFVMGDAPCAFEKALGKKGLKTLFIPTAPHPISGYVLIVDEAELKDIDFSAEDVFKILISCGMVDPTVKQ